MILKQPIIDDGGMRLVLRPGAFYWDGKRLFIGYAWLSSLHWDEQPVWDTNTVPEGTVIESMRGLQYRFVKTLPQPGYKSRIACLDMKMRFYTESTAQRYNRRVIPKDKYITIKEQYVLLPGMVMRQWWSEQSPFTQRRWATREERPAGGKRRDFNKSREWPKDVREVFDNIGGWGPKGGW